jgi:NNP family nitrate/nitrite transporter-like MFS transporter
VKFTDQLKALKDPKVLKYCQYYSIVFGGYVALSAVDGAVLRGRVRPGHPRGRAAGRLLLAARRCAARHRRLLSDKYGAHSVTWWVMWVSWICLFLLSYPQTDFTILTVNGPSTFTSA